MNWDEMLGPRLQKAPWAFDFNQLLRTIDARRALAPRIGESVRARDDAIRLGQDPELDFAPAALSSWTQGPTTMRLGVRFMGLFGPNGALPLHLTELARQRSHNFGDRSLARFGDVFHHRMLSLFYRAWAQAQPAVDYDRPAAARFPGQLQALAGVPRWAAQASGSVPPLALARFAGVLARNAKSSEAVQSVLSAHFGWPVLVEPFTGQWLPLDIESRTRVGASGQCRQLGRDAVVGSKVWDRQYRFTLSVGPLTLEQYEDLLAYRAGPTSAGPEGSLVAVRDWVRALVGQDLRCDLKLRLRAQQVPRARLGGSQRLGWTTWLLGQGASASERDDLRIDVERARPVPPTSSHYLPTQDATP